MREETHRKDDMSDLCAPFLPRLCHFSQRTLSKPSCTAAPLRRSPDGRLRSTAARRLGARCTAQSRHSCCSPTARARRRRRVARLSARRSARSWRRRRRASHARWCSRLRIVKRRKAPPPPPPLPYKVDTSRPSLRTNWTRLVPFPHQGAGEASAVAALRGRLSQARPAAPARADAPADAPAGRRTRICARFLTRWSAGHRGGRGGVR
jgi:hypothetical protein